MVRLTERKEVPASIVEVLALDGLMLRAQTKGE